MNRSLRSLVCAAAFSNCALSAELWVDGSTASTGDGSAAKPFKTITEATKLAKGGDTVTVRAGTYRESISIAQSGTPEQPTTLRAAPGERVIMSGFAPITGWKEEANGIYSATIKGNIAELYVGLQRQPSARWPDFDQPMRRMETVNAAALTFTDSTLAADAAALTAVAAPSKSLRAFLYVAKGNYYTTVPVAAIDLKTGTVTLSDKRLFTNVTGQNDRYQLANHPALIDKPGHWAFEKLADDQTRIYFRPSTPDDLQKTQFPQLARVLNVGHHANPVSNVRVEGLEFSGTTMMAVGITGSENVTFANNIVCFNQGQGVTARNCRNITLKNNIVMANSNGMSVLSTEGAVVEENEIGLNMVDGLIIAGNVSGRPGNERETSNVTARRNYIHHHLLLGHPDNIQTYRGVKDLRIEDTVALYGGQGIMTEETTDCAIHNSIFAGTAAITVICGHSNSHNWTITNSTVGLGGWGLFSFTGEKYRLRNNIIWSGMLPLKESVDSDHNVFWNPDAKAPIALISKPHTRFTTVAEINKATSQDQHSRRTDPKFRNAPAVQIVSPWDDANRPDQLSLLWGKQRDNHVHFTKGDRIEISGDGILRDVTEVAPEYIRFTPALPARPFRDSLIWNWKSATSTQLDLRPAEGSHAATAGENGTAAGANLNIENYQKGDFNGDGQRDLPTLPDDVRQALPNPNNIIVPLQGA